MTTISPRGKGSSKFPANQTRKRLSYREMFRLIDKRDFRCNAVSSY